MSPYHVFPPPLRSSHHGAVQSLSAARGHHRCRAASTLQGELHYTLSSEVTSDAAAAAAISTSAPAATTTTVSPIAIDNAATTTSTA